MGKEDKYKIKNKYTINILGEELLVTGDKSEKYFTKLESYINEIGIEIVQAYPRLPRRKITSLALINLADEYYKLRAEYLDKLKELKSLRKENEEIMALLEEVEK